MENIPQKKQSDLIGKPMDGGQVEVMKIAPSNNLTAASRFRSDGEAESTAPVSHFYESTSVEVVKVTIPILKECISPWLKAKAIVPQKVKWMRHTLLLLPTLGYLATILTLQKALPQTIYDISLAICSGLISLFLAEVWNDHKRHWEEQERWNLSGDKDPLEECIDEIKKKCPDKFSAQKRTSGSQTDC